MATSISIIITFFVSGFVMFGFIKLNHYLRNKEYKKLELELNDVVYSMTTNTLDKTKDHYEKMKLKYVGRKSVMSDFMLTFLAAKIDGFQKSQETVPEEFKDFDLESLKQKAILISFGEKSDPESKVLGQWLLKCLNQFKKPEK
jgi:hypothetical protein